jgi:hypothetical protein
MPKTLQATQLSLTQNEALGVPSGGGQKDQLSAHCCAEAFPIKASHDPSRMRLTAAVR